MGVLILSNRQRELRSAKSRYQFLKVLINLVFVVAVISLDSPIMFRDTFKGEQSLVKSSTYAKPIQKLRNKIVSTCTSSSSSCYQPQPSLARLGTYNSIYGIRYHFSIQTAHSNCRAWKAPPRANIKSTHMHLKSNVYKFVFLDFLFYVSVSHLVLKLGVLRSRLSSCDWGAVRTSVCAFGEYIKHVWVWDGASRPALIPEGNSNTLL